jgi:gp16 family phage-associated protein
MGQPVRPLEEVREEFEIAGMAVSDWAARHGFKRENVYAVLAGRSKGRRGEAHRIAQALGLKPLFPRPTVKVEAVLTAECPEGADPFCVEENAP